MFGHPSAYITTCIVFIENVYKVLEGNQPPSIYHIMQRMCTNLKKSTAHVKDNLIGPTAEQSQACCTYVFL